VVDSLSAPEKGPGFAGLYCCPVKGCDRMFDRMDERAFHLRNHRVVPSVLTGAGAEGMMQPRSGLTFTAE
jgi:hypothetical protein